MLLILKNGALYSIDICGILLLENLKNSGINSVILPYRVEDVQKVLDFHQQKFDIKMDGSRLIWAEPAAFHYCENLDLLLYFEITAYLGYADMNEIIIWIKKIRE
jgi:hypothetical protein